MLYDPRHEHGTLAHFAAWLETQLPEMTYNFDSTQCGEEGCLVSRYLQAVGCKSSPEIFAIYLGRDPGRVAKALPHTYGAALARCRQELSK